jgi:hypothetical protein
MCSTPQTDKSPQSSAPRTPTTPRSIMKRKPSHPTTVPTTPVSKRKKLSLRVQIIQLQWKQNVLHQSLHFLSLSLHQLLEHQKNLVTQISPSKSQPSSSVQPITKRNWVNLSDRVMLSFKEKNDIQNDKKICCNTIDFAQQLLKQQFPSVNGL